MKQDVISYVVYLSNKQYSLDYKTLNTDTAVLSDWNDGCIALLSLSPNIHCSQGIRYVYVS